MIKNNITKLFDDEKLNEQIEIRKNIRMEGKEKKFGFDLPLKQFLKVMFLYFTPQSYGSRIENRLLLECNLKKIPSSNDKGDFITSDKLYGEIKISFKTIKNVYNFVQIRLHQNCDTYVLYAIDTDDDFKTYSFIIPKKDIEFVLKKFKASNCHGVMKNKIDISQIELRFSVTHSDDNWKYLCDNFLCELNSFKRK